MSPWQRHLLMMAGKVEEEGVVMFAPETVVVAAALSVVLVMLVLLCACGDSGSPKGDAEEGDVTRENDVNTKTASVATDPAAVTVDMPVEGETTQNLLTPGDPAPVSNGVANGSRNGAPPSSHSRQASSGSGQMRPTSLRELPDLPVGNHKRNPSGAGVVDKPAPARNSADGKEENNAYDHLGAKIISNNTGAANVNYDHITLESPRDVSSGTTPASEPDTASEGHYAQVRERTYDVVKDVHARASARVTTSSEYDPYAKVKDVEDDKEDPYAKVKDEEKDDADDDYAHLKHDHVIASSEISTAKVVMAEDDEDPYEKVVGDSAGGRVQAAANVADPDDPYSVVSDQTTVTVVPLSGGASPPTSVSNRGDACMANSNQNNSAARVSQSDNLRLQFADEESDTQDDYATVVKDRNPMTSREEEPEGGRDQGQEGEEIEPYFTSPPEPPRMYGASEVGTLQGAVGGVGDDVSSRHDSKEHRYTKVTARESLASMTARNALNTYEIVPDLPENTYATVEGGSGDGVVRYANPGTPNLQHSTSQLNETYAEIGASASGGYASPAPEPPSLDSLHSMTKSTSSNDGDHGNRALTSPSASNGNIIITEDGYALVSKMGFSPSETALPQIPRAGTSGSLGSLGSLGEEVMINGVTLHPDYHNVKDCVPDQDSENDPNYESVDEALSKAPATSALNTSSPAALPVHSISTTAMAPRITIINHTSPSRRNHQYEEVSPPASPVSTSPTTQPSSRVATGVAASANSAATPSLGAASTSQTLDSAEAAEVRDRVLQGHMYEDITEVKKKTSAAAQKAESEKKGSNVSHNVKL